VQTPFAHCWFGAQSASFVQVHCIPMCVDEQTADGPHCAFDVHVVHAWLMQTWPGLHWLLAVQVAQPVVHKPHTWYGMHMPEPGPAAQ
jgi:hypothetical protein